MWCVYLEIGASLKAISQNIEFPDFPLFQLFAQWQIVNRLKSVILSTALM